MRRRDWFTLNAALPLAARAREGQPDGVAVSSANGLRCCARAMDVIRAGGDTLEAAVAGVSINEDDPEDTTVGYGGLPNEDGVVELDASVMHGPTRRAGGVAAVRNIRNPSRLAKLVMEQTDHVMLVGEGAARFARAWGIKEENLLTEKSRIAWMAWKQSLRDPRGGNNWTGGLDAPAPPPGAAAGRLRRMFPGASEETLAWAAEVAANPPTGTITCLVLNRKGEMSGVTSTSGLAWKMPGRVGDSPLIGAGLYVDQDTGAAGCTGRGEENIRVAGAHAIVENMRRGLAPREACLDALKRIARNFNHDPAKLARFDVTYYALRKDGAYASASLWSNRVRRGYQADIQFAVNDGGASRLEKCAFLLDRRP
jgi:N4-(beta-N-acetylglucosaminyl)-L-asparaginase